MRRLRVPPAFFAATLKTVDKTQFGQVWTYAKELKMRVPGGKGLLLSGPPGVGKTYALSALTKFFVEKGSGVKNDHEFVTAPDFFEHMSRGDFGESSDGFRGQSWLRTYCKVPWLVLNDLGKENRAGKFAEQIPYQLGRVIRARSERQLVTHITTNFMGEGILKTYGESIASLLSEMMTFVVVDGADRRVR